MKGDFDVEAIKGGVQARVATELEVIAVAIRWRLG
jgi:hypothetical protein